MEKVVACNEAPIVETEADGNGTARAEEGVSRPRQRKEYSFYLTILMLAMIGLFIAWDATALSLALPSISQALNGTNLQSFWASIAFVLGIAVTQPIYASISDVVGRKYPLYTSIILFIIGSIVFSTANGMNIVIAGRLIKGLGGGGLDVLQTIILCDVTTLKERPRWLGVMSMANAVGVVTGPFIGALFVQDAGWPWLGWINLIAVGISGLLAFFFLHLTPVEGDMKSNVKKLDWSGFALFVVISTAVALPLSWAGELYPWASWQTLVPLLVGLLLIVPFVFIEKRAAVPMIPYKKFDNVSLIAGVVTIFIYGALLNSIVLYLPLFFQAAYFETPIRAAISTMPICCVIVVASIAASMVIDWSRKYRIILLAGWGISSIFLGLHYIVGAETSRAQAYAFQALLGAGLGMAMVAGMIAGLANVRRVDDEGPVAGIFITMRFVGSLISLAICSTIFSSMFEKRLSTLEDLPEQLAVLEDASQAVGFIPQMKDVRGVPENAMRVVVCAYDDAFHTIWAVLATFGGLATILSTLIKENSLEKEDVGRQGLKPLSE